MPFDVLTVNGGSSSLKFALFEARNTLDVDLLFRGEIDHLHATPTFLVRDHDHEVLAREDWTTQDAGHEAAFVRLLRWLRTNRGIGHLNAAGHRVVHGGDAFTAPVSVDEPLLSALETYTPLAPLHQPHQISAIRALRTLEPDLPQVACFDTSFHRTIPKTYRRFALPLDYEAQGIRRYGFHGLSYEYIARELRRTAPALANGRVVVAHLGSGATLCAMRGAESVDTSAGMTALDGLPMATRCGAIDPGVLLYLMRERHFGPNELEDLLCHRSGWRGLSGMTSSMRELLESEDPRAIDAVDYFVFRVAREIAALIPSLGGLDGVVFTGGIGEHAAPIRSWVCGRLAWLGVHIDEAANARDAELISFPDSRVSVHIIPTDEERTIALHTLECIHWSDRAIMSTAQAFA